MTTETIPFCTFCLHDDELHNEASWVIELVTPDSEVIQRILACHSCATAAFMNMVDEPAQFETGNYTIMRRWMPSDSVLRIDPLFEIDLDDEDDVA